MQLFFIVLNCEKILYYEKKNYVYVNLFQLLRADKNKLESQMQMMQPDVTM